MTDPLGQSQVLPYIEALSLNYNFFLISCEKPDTFAVKEHIIRERLRGKNISWFPISYHKFPPVLSTLYDIKLIKATASEIIKINKIDLIHCRSYISSLIGLKFKRRNNIPFVFDMRGFWADERVDGELWNLKNPLYRTIYHFFKKKEKNFIEESAAVISLTQAGAEIIKSWKLNFDYKKLFVIPCCADFHHFSLISKEQVAIAKRKKNLPAGSLVITYLGSLGTWYLLDEMLLFFKKILEIFHDSYFQILTSEDSQKVFDKAQGFGIPKERIIVSFSERKNLVENMSLTDLSIFFIKPSFSKKSSSPTKLAELLAMGIPVICNDEVGDVKTIIHNLNCGITISDFEETALEKAVSQIPQLLKKSRESIRKRAEEHFSLSRGVEEYKKVYKLAIEEE